MIINHNMAALNTYRQLTTNNTQTGKSLEKLSSGLRINRAGDDAAGLAISEKMRGQIRGLDQATRNSQDGISMIQTAEGSLNEVHSILQRMKELATQAANDTNVDTDRQEIQKEINQLSSEINRIGNTTEFNTQSLLKGDGKESLGATGLFATKVSQAGANVAHTDAENQTVISDGVESVAAGDDLSWDINGQTVKVVFADYDAAKGSFGDAYGVTTTGTTTTVTINGAGTAGATKYVAGGENTFAADVADALKAAIAGNEILKDNFDVGINTATISITAKSGGAFEGGAGNISDVTNSLTTATTADGTDVVGKSTPAQPASTTIDFATLSLDTKSEIEALVEKGFTINSQQVEFYDATKGAYTGNAIGVNISDAINASANNEVVLADVVAAQLSNKLEGITATDDGAGVVTLTTTATGTSATLEITDGGVQSNFKATFQVGANKGQSFTVDISDMRSQALGITAKAGSAGFLASNVVTDGTSETVQEAALDVSSHKNATAAIDIIDQAIGKVSAERSKLGAFTNRLEHTINNLGTSSENLTAAESRIRDVDMAKEMMSFQKNNILSQAAQAMLAQANQQPQGVLQLLR